MVPFRPILMLISRTLQKRLLPLLLAVVGAAIAANPPAAAAKVTLSSSVDAPYAVPGASLALRVQAEIDDDWHINAHEPKDPFLVPTVLTIETPAGVEIGAVVYPQPLEKSFAFAAGKTLLVYEGEVPLRTTLALAKDFAGSEVTLRLKLRFQACNDTTCLPPRTITGELVVPVEKEAAALAAEPVQLAGSGLGIGVDFAGWIRDHGLLPTLLLVLLLGLGLNLTPCVYPLISVTLAYFGSQAKQDRGAVARLAAAYVLGITLTFSLVGVAAAFSGGIFGAALQKPPVLLFLASLMTLLALSSFGLYQMQPPAWLMQRLGGATRGAAGALFMGSTMGIVAAPCVGPVVLGLIVFVGSQQSVALGLSLFFALGLGMGLPYLGLAMVAGSLKALPRSGDWLVWVERLFGFVLLGMALHFVLPLLPREWAQWALPLLLAVAGLYLGFIDRSGAALRFFRPLQHAMGVAVLALAVWLAVPQAAQSHIAWQPLQLDSVAAATRLGRPAVVDFGADWCIPCHEMKSTTFVDAAVVAESARFAMFEADISLENEHTTALTQHFKVQGVPTVIYFDANGREVNRLVGYVGPEAMLAAMRALS